MGPVVAAATRSAAESTEKCSSTGAAPKPGKSSATTFAVPARPATCGRHMSRSSGKACKRTSVGIGIRSLTLHVEAKHPANGPGAVELIGVEKESPHGPATFLRAVRKIRMLAANDGRHRHLVLGGEQDEILRSGIGAAQDARDFEEGRRRRAEF